ncbi:hypothetical protein WJU16_18295 [Chitinophaga pollutisoli]|uniref:Uncharacterized protein n=1 Tax=Chitinophaga pollutisoli TaxID=3133966 RepID=A0ABZ2YJN0_9BACT
MIIVKLSNDSLDKDTRLIEVGTWDPGVDLSKDPFIVRKAQAAIEVLTKHAFPGHDLLPGKANVSNRPS